MWGLLLVATFEWARAHIFALELMAVAVVLLVALLSMAGMIRGRRRLAVLETQLQKLKYDLIDIIARLEWLNLSVAEYLEDQRDLVTERTVRGARFKGGAVKFSDPANTKGLEHFVSERVLPGVSADRSRVQRG